MRVAKLQVRIVMLAVLALSASGCQTAQRPASLLPARTAPALTSTAQAPAPARQQTPPATPPASTPRQPQVPVAAAETKTQSSSTQSSSVQSPSPQAPPPALTSDPVADL